MDVRFFDFPAGESRKTFETVGAALDFLARERFTRSDFVLAFGGGVPGDLAGFAAAIYLRGVRFLQVPTTLLAAVDSSVGGKTGVDLPQGKNLAGAFWQPSAVYCDPDFFRTLPDERVAEGYAKMIKHGLLPGIIPQAHRGIIFIDEINRLADMSPEITDVLLDVMGGKPGHIQIEEAGLEAVDLPVNVSVWAASNPDEDPGSLEEIRRQLSDRFDVLCFMGRPDTEQTIVDILQENLFSQRQIQNSDLPSYRSDMADKKEMQEWAERYKHLPLPAFIQSYIARIYLKYNIESIRAIESMTYLTGIIILPFIHRNCLDFPYFS